MALTALLKLRVLRAAGVHLGLLLTPILAASEAAAKIPGAVYCSKRVCHRVKTLAETAGTVGRVESVLASYYDDPSRDRFNPRRETSSGEMFVALDDSSAASPIYPNGTKLLLFNPVTRDAALVRVNNTGPFFSVRRLDVSRGVAERLGFAADGVARLLVKVVYAPTADEARYQRGRSYARVTGYLGKIDGIEGFDAIAMEIDTTSPTAGMAQGTAPSELRSRAAGPFGLAMSASLLARRAAVLPRNVVLQPVNMRRPHLRAAVERRPTRLAAAR